MTAALRFEGVSVQLGAIRPLQDVTLEVPPGAFVALVGPNGAGKSTLLKAALGWVKPSAGRALIDGQDVAALSHRDRAGVIGWLPQGDEITEPITTLDLVAAARYRFDERRAETLSAANRALEDAGVSALAHRRMDQLSGGERQRVGVAALVAQDTQVVLLDEPGSHLDPAGQLEIYALLGALWRSGRSVVCVTHDPNLLHHVLGSENPGPVRVAGLSDGVLRFDESFDAPSLPERMTELFGVAISATEIDGRRHLVVTERREGASP